MTLTAGHFPAEWHTRPNMPPAFWEPGRGWVRV